MLFAHRHGEQRGQVGELRGERLGQPRGVHGRRIDRLNPAGGQGEPQTVLAHFQSEPPFRPRQVEEVDHRPDRKNRGVAREGGVDFAIDQLRHRAAGPLRLHDQGPGL